MSNNSPRSDIGRTFRSSVTSKGQITIPAAIRRRCGVEKGTRIEVSVLGDELRFHVVRRGGAAR